MKKTLLIFLCTLFAFLLTAQRKIIIGELLYDTPLSETSGVNRYNGEFVSVYNYGNDTVDISGWVVTSAGTGQTFTFPTGSIMCPDAKFYVAYRNIRGNFKLADLYKGFQLGENDKEFYQNTIIHANTGEYVTLYKQDGTIQDSLYYNGTSGAQPRLEAKNEDNISGYTCASIQRTNVTTANGLIVFNKSDYTTKQVALERYSRTTLTENGKSVVETFSEKMSHIFEHVDKSRIITGLLSDYGVQLVAFAPFNGVINDSSFVNIDIWKMLYAGIFSSKINDNITLPLPETVFSQIRNAAHSTAVPVTVMHYQYNQLKEDALDSNLMQVINGDQLQDVPGAASPYLLKDLFAVAPKEMIFTNGTASFIFNQNLWFENVSKIIWKLEVNFNNESGYMSAYPTIPISYAFNTDGIKTIYFRLTYIDGTSYTSQTNIYVTEEHPTLSNIEIEEIPIPQNNSYLNPHSGGKIQIKYANDNDKTLRKPLIVAEGFDPSSVINPDRNPDIYYFLREVYINDSTHIGRINVSYPSSTGRLYNDLISAGYDIVYLDYGDGLDDIWHNAALFKQVIDTVNARKQGTEPNVVMGISMGGLVARIALRKMEIEGRNHQTKKYISVDSPHKGANVPLGFQAAVRHLASINFKILFWTILDMERDIEPLSNGIKLLNSKAAKQMLIYTIDSNYRFNNQEHADFQRQYDELGLPQQCENIAISNGSNIGNRTMLPGSTILDFNHNIHFTVGEDILTSLIGCIGLVFIFPPAIYFGNWDALGKSAFWFAPGHSQLKMEFKVNALKNKQRADIYHGHIYIDKEILFFIPATLTLNERKVKSEPNMLAVDGAQGGIYSMNSMGLNLAEIDLSGMSGGGLSDERIAALEESLKNSIKQSRFCFVPTVSALALNDWETRLEDNLTGYLSTPFTSVFSQGNNELHTRFNSYAKFLCTHLVFPDTLFGLENICANIETNYSIGNLPTGAYVTWTASGNLSIPPNNTGSHVTITGMQHSKYGIHQEDGWINAEIYYNGMITNLYKDVIVGYVPHAPMISSDKYGDQVDYGVYCGFFDAITYHGNLVTSSNSAGIFDGEWRNKSYVAIQSGDASAYWNVINSTVTGVKAYFPNTGGSPKAYAEVRLQNSCGWSDWVEIMYNRGLLCNGGITPPGGGLGGLTLTSPLPSSPQNMNMSISYTNPAQTDIKITFNKLPTQPDETEIYTINLLDQSGIILRSSQVTHHRNSNETIDDTPNLSSINFNVSSLRTGLYFLHVQGANESIQEQIIIKN